jgi:hypothetical protein
LREDLARQNNEQGLEEKKKEEEERKRGKEREKGAMNIQMIFFLGCKSTISNQSWPLIYSRV